MIFFILFTVTACVGTPDGITAVRGFEQERNLGTWYEITRIDNRFERGLSNVIATYSVKDNGDIRVVNRGYKAATNLWNEAKDTGRFL